MLKYIVFLIIAMTISMHTIPAYAMRLHMHLHLTDKKTAQKIGKTLWHSGQIAGAIAYTHLFYHNIPVPIYKKIVMLACLIPSIYTLIDCGVTGLHNLYVKKKTMPESFKDKIKIAVHNW